MSLSPGDRLGPYEIEAQIGRGGMGEVYRARDTNLDRDVAIKVLPDELASDDERVARFEREAKVLASLNHPNIAAIYGFEQNALVLELVEGSTLAERIEQGPIPIEEAIAIARQVAEALEAGHEAGIIHRDLKPANVKVKDDGTVKVLDYGLAKALEGDVGSGADANSQLSQSPTLTRQGTAVGVILGTAAYMSPEQAKGKRVDRRTDIWAFGAVVFEMLTGKRAFGGEDVSETLAAVIRGEPEWKRFPSHTPAPVVRLLKRALTRDLRRRLQAIGEARIVLEDVASGDGAGEPAPARSKPGWLAALPWAVATLALALALFFVTTSRPPSPELTRLELSPPPLSGSPSRTTQLGARAVLSPDGRFMAYANGGSSKLLVHAMDQPGWTELAGTEGAFSPFFSPDGEWLGFFAGTTLKKVSRAGAAPVTLCDVRCTACGGSWGSEGTIVYSDVDGLFAVRAESGACELLLDEPGVLWPNWLPGERALLVTTRGETGPRVELVRLPGGEHTVLQEDAFHARYVPSGHLAFMRGNDLHAAAFDARRLALAGGPAMVFRNVQASPAFLSAQFAFSHNDSLVYLSGPAGRQRSSLTWVARDGTTSPIPSEPNYFAQPRLSPDGNRIAVSDIDPTSGQNIWLVDARNGVSTRLTFGGLAFSPVWSPDGRYVGFSSTRNNTLSAYRKRADGSGEEERLGASLVGYAIAWSPDDKFLVILTERGMPGVTATDSSGVSLLPLGNDSDGELVPFLPRQFHESAATFSPDGRFLAYHAMESDTDEVYVLAFPEAGGKWQVSNGGGRFPRFSPKGDELFYWNDGRMIAVRYTTDGDTFVKGRETVLFSGEFAGNDPLRDYDVSPDGQRFLMLLPAGADESPSIHLVQNWYQELKRLAPAK